MIFLPDNLKRCLCIACLLSAILCGPPALAQDIHDPGAVIARVGYAMAAITDYTCTFSKHELVGDRIIKEDDILLKVKRPGHFYMKWTEGKHRGRVAIYVEGSNNSKMLIHMNGMLSFLHVAIDPEGKEAYEENRHSIKEADFISIFERFAADCSKCLTDPDCTPVMSELKDPDTVELTAEFPQDKGYYARRARMTIDKCTWLPKALVCFGWDNEFLEEYLFDDIKINPGLADQDFEMD